MSRATFPMLIMGLSLAPALCWGAGPNDDQARAIAAIEKLGDKVTVDEKSPDKPAIGVNLTKTEVMDAGLVHLERLTQLQWLDLGGTQVTDAGLKHLEGLTQLQWLGLLDTKVTDAGLAHLKGLTQLQLLYLQGTLVTDAGLVHLKGLTKLRWLYLQGTRVTGAGLVNLKGLRNLETLSLNGTKVADAGLEHLRGLTQLQCLELAGANVTDAGLENLKGLTQLSGLELDDTKVTDAGLVHLKGMTKLWQLHLEGTQVTGTGLEHLKGLAQLSSLYLSDTQVTDAGLEYVRGLPHLVTLRLLGTQITDAGLERLTGLSGLRSVSLINTKVTRRGSEKLQRALPDCVVMTDMPTPELSGLLLSIFALAVVVVSLLFGVYRWIWVRRKTEKIGPGKGSVERQRVGIDADVGNRSPFEKRRWLSASSVERFVVGVLRWAARAIGIVFLLLGGLLTLVRFCGADNLFDMLPNMSPRESPLLVGGFIFALGLIVAWKWEGLGGILILGGGAFLAIVNYGIDPVAFGILLLPAFLFLCCWWRTPKRKEGGRIIAGVVLLALLVGSAGVLNALRERAIGRDCERLISWVRSSHLAPGAHDLALPAEFHWLSVTDGKVDATVLKDGRVILLLKTSFFGHDYSNWRGILYCSAPLKPHELEGYFDRIDIKVNDHLYFVEFNLN